MSKETYLNWLSWSAVLGAIVWIALVVLLAGGRISLGIIEILMLLAPLVIVPLGFSLVVLPRNSRGDDLLFLIASLLQPLAVVALVVSFWFSPGIVAALWTSGWLLVSGLAGLSGLIRSFQRRFVSAEENCVDAALLFLPVGAFSLFLSRLGATPLDYQEPIVILTAVHFYYAGFATALVAGITGRALACSNRHRLFRLVAAGVIAGPFFLAVGFILFAPLLKIVSASLFVVNLLGLSIILLCTIVEVRQPMARVLLGISGGSLFVGMPLAGLYAIGEFTGYFLITIPEMARIHGIANGIGFALCGLLAWFFHFSKVREGGEIR